MLQKTKIQLFLSEKNEYLILNVVMKFVPYLTTDEREIE